MKTVEIGKVVFCLCCIEKLFPRLVQFSKKHQIVGSDQLRVVLDACWAAIRQGNLNEIKQLAKAIKKTLNALAPDTEDYPEPDAHIALSCITAFEYFVKYISSPKDDFITVVNDSVLDAIDQKLSELFIDELEESGDYSIVETHQFFLKVKSELDIQRKTLADLQVEANAIDAIKIASQIDLILECEKSVR